MGIALSQLIESSVLPECHSSHIVLVDGNYDASLSNRSDLPSACVCLPMKEAMRTHSSILQNGAALESDGLFLYIPDSIEVGVPLQIISIQESAIISSAQFYLWVGKRSKINIIETMVGQGKAVQVTDVYLDKEAMLQIVDETDVDLSRNFRATLCEDAIIDRFSYSNSAAMIEQNIHVILSERGATADCKGLDRLQGKRKANTEITIEHKAPHSTSRQYYKKILEDRSRSNSLGKVRIESKAQKAQASQLFCHLILSDSTVSAVKPEMEVLADDVSASHAAIFSQPNEDEIFYFRTRGLSLADAKKLSMQGYCNEIIEQIKIPWMREHFRKKVAL